MHFASQLLSTSTRALGFRVWEVKHAFRAPADIHIDARFGVTSTADGRPCCCGARPRFASGASPVHTVLLISGTYERPTQPSRLSGNTENTTQGACRRDCRCRERTCRAARAAHERVRCARLCAWLDASGARAPAPGRARARRGHQPSVTCSSAARRPRARAPPPIAAPALAAERLDTGQHIAKLDHRDDP